MVAEDTQDQLEAEIKLLNWHKLANETALKAALMKTKQMKERDRQNQQRGGESLRVKAAWMQRVIEEEQAKPLQVSKEFVLSYQAREKREEERLDEEVNRHIEGLKRLRAQIEKRDELRSKKEAYQRHRAQVTAQKRAAASSARKAAREEERAAQEAADAAAPPKGAGTLTTVISSLDRLVDLERRIASLENDAIYDRIDAAAGGPAAKKGASSRRQAGGSKAGLSFVRQRVPASTGAASKDVYSVRVNARKPNRGPVGSQRASAASAAALGGGPSSQALRRPAGFKSFQPDVSRQDAAISNWLERKKQRQQRQQRAAGGPVEPPTVGAASGRRGKNAAHQQFLDMKRGVERRQDAMHGRPSQRGGSTMMNRKLQKPNGTNAGAATTRRPNTFGNSLAANATNRANHKKRSQTSGAPKKTLPHIAGAGVKGARGVRQAW